MLAPISEVTTLNSQLTDEKQYLEVELQQEFGDIVGVSPAVQQVLKAVKTVAPTDSTVLILGETGTGKELIARAIHNLSPRRGRSFVRTSVAALPETLLEGELFGHEKGAFTGATASRAGRVELANRGTLFLDEVGDIPAEMQPKLLRVLQEREFERLGSAKTVRVDVRVVAATNRDLERMVEEGEFRSDLFYRLNVFPITMPPLRDRADDIPALARHFAALCARRMGRPVPAIPAAAMQALQQWQWPGNIRELQNVIERAVILTTGPTLQLPLQDLQPKSRRGTSGPKPAATLKDAERDAILSALRDSGGVIEWTDRSGGAAGAAADDAAFEDAEAGYPAPVFLNRRPPPLDKDLTSLLVRLPAVGFPRVPALSRPAYCLICVLAVAPGNRQAAVGDADFDLALEGSLDTGHAFGGFRECPVDGFGRHGADLLQGCTSPIRRHLMRN